MEMVLGTIADRGMFGLRMDYVVIFWNTKNFTIRRKNMDRECNRCIYHTEKGSSKWECEGTVTVDDVEKKQKDITRKGLEVAIHLYVEACNRKAVREFAEWLCRNYTRIKQDSIGFEKFQNIYWKSIDEVLAEYEKEKTHEQNK